MQKAKWMGIPIMMFWACLGMGTTVVFVWAGSVWAGPAPITDPGDTDGLAEVTPVPSVVSLSEDPPEALPLPEEDTRTYDEILAETEASLSGSALSRTAGVSVSVADMMRRMRRTPVQLAPSFYPGYGFSEIETTRRRMAARFNRRAPERTLIGDDQALYDITLLVLSRGIVHEANFMHRPCGEFHIACDPNDDHNHAEIDGPAMYAVFRHTRATGETLIGSIRRHMRYVTELAPPRSPRSRWIVELDLEGNRPEHFPATDANGNPLNWERDYLPRWQQVIEMSRRLLDGRDLGVCANAPLLAWGGRCEDSFGACDDDFGRRRGLVPIECGPSSNRFWCRPGSPGCPDEVLPTVATETPPTEETPVEVAPPEEALNPVAEEPPVEVTVEDPSVVEDPMEGTIALVF